MPWQSVRKRWQSQEAMRFALGFPRQVPVSCYLAAAFAFFLAAAFGSTAALNFEPAVNLGTVPARILRAAPVLGFLPMRAARFTDLNVPKPTSVTESPFLTASWMVSIKVSRMRPAATLDSSFLETIFS